MTRPAPRPSTPPGLGHQVLLLLAKDLRLEWRSREILYTMLLFSALVVVLFSFAFSGGERADLPDVAGGILWVVVVFAGTLGLGRLFTRELAGGTHRAVLLSPASPAALYLAKVAGLVVLVGLTEAAVLALLLVLLDLSVSAPALLLGLLALGTLGFSLVGCLFAAILLRSSGREVMLGILLYPLVTPLVIAGARGTAAALAPDPALAASAVVWLKLMGGFDVVFAVLSLWTFGPLTRQE